MAYTVNWLTKVITIPQTDLVLVSGFNYTLDVDLAHDEIRRLEWEFADGLWAEQAIEYINTQLLSGLVYSPIVKMVNGYTWLTDATNINISLIGSNTNMLDTFTPGNGVSVLANNSAGKILVGVSGLSPAQSITLDNIDSNVIIVDGKVDVIDTNIDQLLTDVAAIQSGIDVMAVELTDVWKAHFHRRTWNGSTLMHIYNVDGTTVWRSFDTNADLSNIDPQ